MPAKPRLTTAQLITIATLLLLVFFIRAHESLAMPAFNDESLHIRRSEIVWTFDNPATSFTVGKLLGYYWLGAFGFDRLDALHGGRLVYALFILIGAAATYRVGRSLFNHMVGLLALLLYAFNPYLIFYERLILADQLAASFGMLTIWAGIRLARNPTRKNGLLSGVFITFAVLAKLTAIPFALVPLAAILILGKRDTQGTTSPPGPLSKRRGGGMRGDQSPFSARERGFRGEVNTNEMQIDPLSENFLRKTRSQVPRPEGEGFRVRASQIIPRRYWPALLTCYGFNLLSGLPFMLFPLFREVSEEPVLVVGTDLFVSSGWDRVLVENVPRLWEVLRVYFGLIPVLLVILLIGRLLIRKSRAALYLIVCVLLPWSLILPLSPNPSNRYWLPGIPPLLVLIAGALWATIPPFGRGVMQYTPTGKKQSGTIFSALVLLMITIWIAALAAPFIGHAWTDPLELRLTEHDRWEYYQNFASGYGLDAAIRAMQDLPISETSGRIPVAGLVGSCHQLRLYLPEDGLVDLSCPFFGWQGEYMDAVSEHILDRIERETVVYLLVEPELRFTDLSVIPVRWELVERFPRPWNGMVVELYKVYSLD